MCVCDTMRSTRYGRRKLKLRGIPGRKFSKVLSLYDGRLRHPFTCLVSGSSGSGKSTLVLDILSKRRRLIDTYFHYITIFLGTSPESNPNYLEFKERFPKLVQIVDVRKLYPSQEDIKSKLSGAIRTHVAAHGGKPGCLLFDDLMNELSTSGGILTELFTKLCSHSNLSSIHITQNLFSKSAGGATDHTTLYRNSHYIILFDSPLDGTVISHVARRIAGPGKGRRVQNMLMDIVRKHRYVMISGNLKTPRELQFRSAITADKPTPHQLVFQLAEE